MKKSLITIVSVLCIVVASATMAAATTRAPTSAARSTVAGATSASSRFPTTCPPAGVVGKALGLTVSKPTVVMYAKGLALECKYTSGKGKTTMATTLSYTSATLKAFLAEEKSLPKGSVVVVTNLGKGVTAFGLTAFSLYFQDGTLKCILSTMASTVDQEALAKVLLKSYW
jgi:hypothetical protein